MRQRNVCFRSFTCRVVHAGIIWSIIVRNQHQALCQHNSKKNCRKYVKISKINKYIGVRYSLKIGIPDFLWRNIHDKRLGPRLPFTTGNRSGHGTGGGLESGTYLCSNFQNGGRQQRNLRKFFNFQWLFG